jgi:SAM-dependent methyltransferase
MLPRTLEPEVMDTAEEVADYDAMDHATVNRVFVDDFLAAWGGGSDPHPGGGAAKHSELGRVLDVGTGTALIPIELGRRGVACRVTAIDLAAEMLKLARQNVAAAGLSEVIALELVDAKGLPYGDATFDAVMSNSIVHHIPQPRGTLAEMRRVVKRGGLLFVRDLLRPESSEEVERIVEMYAGRENAHQRQLFRQSLHAALTVDEVRGLLRELSLPEGWARQTSDRHWTLWGRVEVES